MRKTIPLRVAIAWFAWVSLNSTGFAKRTAPPEVASVSIGDIEFRAPAQNMGYI